MFDEMLNETELAVWKSFKQVCLNFLGLHKSNDFKDVVANLLHRDARCHLRFTFYNHVYHVFLKTWEQFQMSTMRDFARTLLLLKRGSKESGQLECSPNTAGY